MTRRSYTRDKVVRILNIAKRPLTVTEILMIVNPESSKKGRQYVYQILRELKDEGMVTCGVPDLSHGRENTWRMVVWE